MGIDCNQVEERFSLRVGGFGIGTTPEENGGNAGEGLYGCGGGASYGALIARRKWKLSWKRKRVEAYDKWALKPALPRQFIRTFLLRADKLECPQGKGAREGESDQRGGGKGRGHTG